MADTKIEWTERVWNPLVGCSLESPGCTHCYAMKMAARLERMGSARYAGLTRDTKAGAVWTGEVRLVEEALTQPLRWKRPRRIFVNSMSDLFHEDVPDEWIDRVFAVMALAPQHVFQVLTKRAERMRRYVTAARAHPVGLAALDRTLTEHTRDPRSTVGDGVVLQGDIVHLRVWPLPNVHLGVSVEDQPRADERIPHLLATPAAVRWISAEPLLGPIDLRRLPSHFEYEDRPLMRLDALRGVHSCGPSTIKARGRLDWVVVGGESGPGARPMHPDWARSLRNQCAAAGVPFFFKQWGAWAPAPDGGSYAEHRKRGASDCRVFPDLTAMELVGKARAGSLLDGVEHKAMPEGRT